jgi:hypothetical protein
MKPTTEQTTAKTCAGCVRHDPQTAYCQLWGWTRRATDRACPERAVSGKAEKPNADLERSERSADSVQADVRFCLWTWDDSAEQRWVTGCGYGFLERRPNSSRDGKVLPFPFCPYCGKQIRKPNAPREGRAAARTLDPLVRLWSDWRRKERHGLATD